MESAYGDALEIEFARAGIPYVREDEVRVIYDGRPLKTTYRADFTCFDRSYIVELKAIRSLSKVEWAQVIHYTRATKIRFALLVNFGRAQLQYETFDLERLSTVVSEQEINPDLPEPSRGPLRPLRGSAFGLGQPDAFGAGALTLRLLGGLGVMPPVKEKRSVSGASDTSEFTNHEPQSVEDKCLERCPHRSTELDSRAQRDSRR